MIRAIAVAALLIGSIPAALCAMPTVRIGKVDSAKTCTLYKMTAGVHREAGVDTPFAAAYASQTAWVDYLVRDCVSNFASLRTSLQAALASTGKLAVAPGAGGADYVVNAHLSEVGGTGGEPPAHLNPSGVYAISSSTMFVNLDLTVQDRSGRIIHSGLLTKHIETGFNMATQGGLHTQSSQSGEAVYGELQHEVALAAARIVAFKIEPLRVTGVDGRTIHLNYGAPLLQLGMMVQVTTPEGSMVKYTVTGAGQGSAEADYYGGGDAARVTPGSSGIVLESDDSATNGRRFKKVDLPEG